MDLKEERYFDFDRGCKSKRDWRADLSA